MGDASFENELQFEVRDYECDLQGVVNNANYLHYLEHARHSWLEEMGIDFAALHKEGIDLVVARIEIDYRYPLQSRDRFVVRSKIRRDGKLKLICNQDIYRMPDEKLIAQAVVVAVALQEGRPIVPSVILAKLGEDLADH